MIELYTWTTPNGYKPLILLEELGLDYDLKWVRLDGQQKSPEFLKINPNGKIPAIVDRGADEGGKDIVVFESGAILIYLAEQSGRFLPATGGGRAAVIQWLMFQMANVGPMFGQYHHFKNAQERIPYAIDRYGKEVRRIYDVLEKRLSESAFLAGSYSIADMATYPWVRNPAGFGMSFDTMPNVKRWADMIGKRPAVQKAVSQMP